MTPLIVGIDVSSRQLDFAFIPLDPTTPGAPFFHTETLGPKNADLLWRLRHVRLALTNAYIAAEHGGGELMAICIEDPYSMSMPSVRALNRTVGAIIASAHTGTNVAVLKANEWRRILGATPVNNKAAGHDAIRRQGVSILLPRVLDDEHQLDALGVALAHRIECWAASEEGGQ